MHAYLGKSAAAATWPPPWRQFQREHPEAAAELELIWSTPSLLNNALMVRDDLPATLVEQLRGLLHGLAQLPEGRAILETMETAAFHPADNASYAQVSEYVARFEAEVRKVEDAVPGLAEGP